MMERYRILILLGVLGLVTGVALPFLMVIGLLTSTLGLNFFAFICQVGGLFLGLMGLANYARRGRD
ncbi:hypothetical protein H5T57_05060 [Candidatus Bipolaricaulota bacterium]|nr:hypothetical protein [Candidatus Bipolaricaulota bacterium]